MPTRKPKPADPALAYKVASAVDPLIAADKPIPMDLIRSMLAKPGKQLSYCQVHDLVKKGSLNPHTKVRHKLPITNVGLYRGVRPSDLAEWLRKINSKPGRPATRPEQTATDARVGASMFRRLTAPGRTDNTDVAGRDAAHPAPGASGNSRTIGGGSVGRSIHPGAAKAGGAGIQPEGARRVGRGVRCA